MCALIFCVLLTLIIRLAYILLIHETIIAVNNWQKKDILEKGMFHYTSIENALKIMDTGILVGQPDYKSIFKSKRSQSIVWLLLDSERWIYRHYREKVLKRHCPINPTGVKRTIRYEVKLHIIAFENSHIQRMRFSPEFSIGYYGDNLHGIKILPATIDDIDKKLGICSISDYLGVREGLKANNKVMRERKESNF